MKKAVIAVFSVSLTAGTLYLPYTQVKDHMIKKLVSVWQEEAKKQSKELSADQVKHLKEGLDKLYAWEVKWLATYTQKAFARASEKELSPLLTKIKNKNIRDRADLKSVDTLLFGT